MKTAFLSIVCGLVVSAQAAITTWSASLSSTTEFAGGYVYLIEVTDTTTWTSQAIINHIKTNGLTGSKDGVKATGTLSASSIYNTESLSVAANASASYYTLFLTSAKDQFVLSEVGTIGDNDIFIAGGVPADATEPDYAAYFNEIATSSWSANGGDVAPEPTVMALLALGVAGLALRRKVK